MSPFNRARRRNRLVYAALVLAVIAAGLASRRFPGLLPAQLGKYPGDALWALMVMLMIGCARSRWPVAHTATAALATSFAVEFSQLYRADWILAIRHTTLGHLVLGSGFHAADLLAYTVGVAAGVAVDLAASRRPPPGNARAAQTWMADVPARGHVAGGSCGTRNP